MKECLIKLGCLYEPSPRFAMPPAISASDLTLRQVKQDNPGQELYAVLGILKRIGTTLLP